MANVLSIESQVRYQRHGAAIDTVYSISASFRGWNYQFGRLQPVPDLRTMTANGIITFVLKDAQPSPWTCNYIVVSTDLVGRHSAVGFVDFPTSSNPKPTYYTMGDDLEIRLDDTTRAAFRQIKETVGYGYQEGKTPLPEHLVSLLDPIHLN
ncbi:hypothetical protein JXB02_04815 [Candidatus Woesearchaeota archaeon]|nr:hypothetical protein [Candidatus Woesearchaeota archaeon]